MMLSYRNTAVEIKLFLHLCKHSIEETLSCAKCEFEEKIKK